MMQFANEGNNVRFSCRISNSIPNLLMLPQSTLELLKFIDIDFVGTENLYTNYSRKDNFMSSPQMGITADLQIFLKKKTDAHKLYFLL